jgi:hypothetical protein
VGNIPFIFKSSVIQTWRLAILILVCSHFHQCLQKNAGSVP